MTAAATVTAPGPPALDTLRLSVNADDIGVLTLDRPDELNAMSPAMLAELPRITAWLADEAALRGLVITGAGEAFSIGGDLKAMRALVLDPGVDIVADSRERIGQLHAAILNLRRIEYPVVAAVNGVAAGSGWSLALACDDRIASREASFRLGYGRLGLSPDGGITYLLPRLMGEVRALSLMLSDRATSAEDALALGLVSQVVEPERVTAVAMRRAGRLAGMAPLYTAATKRLVQSSGRSTLAQQLELERASFAEASGTEDFSRGLEAFFGGRRPLFEGDRRRGRRGR